jgi:hypothetical protein
MHTYLYTYKHTYIHRYTNNGQEKTKKNVFEPFRFGFSVEKLSKEKNVTKRSSFKACASLDSVD